MDKQQTANNKYNKLRTRVLNPSPREDLMAGDGQLSLLPLVYVHPATGEETMCFHLGKGYCLGWIEEKEGAAPEKKAWGGRVRRTGPCKPSDHRQYGAPASEGAGHVWFAQTPHRIHIYCAFLPQPQEARSVRSCAIRVIALDM